MFVSLAIHRPKPRAEDGLIDAMHRFRDAAIGAPGLQHIHTLRSADQGILVGLAIWDSEDAFHAARAGIRRSRTSTSGRWKMPGRRCTCWSTSDVGYSRVSGLRRRQGRSGCRKQISTATQSVFEIG